MKAAIVTIGDELLTGHVLDTNSQFMAKALDQLGIQVVELLSISDDFKSIMDTLERFQDHVDFLILTGGLGPTKDDVTKKTLCAYLHDELVRDQQVHEHVRHLFEDVFQKPFLPINHDQALVPKQCEVLFNAVGTAPGMWMPSGKTVIISLPGVPFEMRYLMQELVLPKIVANYSLPYRMHQNVRVFGIGESFLAEKIAAWEEALPENLKLAYLPTPGEVKLRLTTSGWDKEKCEQLLSSQVDMLVEFIKDERFTLDDSDLTVKVGELLKEIGKFVGLAESCTGGKLAQVFTSIPGCSSYFKGGVVCYHEAVKQDILGVTQASIDQFSVVSAEVAEEMAIGAQRVLNVDFAISITGNAGPTTDATSEPVGVVYIGIASPNGVSSHRFNFGQPREKVVDRAVNKSLELVHEEILKFVQ